jgi:hypothetical protein
MMKKLLETAKRDNRGESLRGLQEVSKERITSVGDQYFTNLGRVGESDTQTPTQVWNDKYRLLLKSNGWGGTG